jgi:DNA-binding HxlR family transcriptional regulator
MALPKEYAEAGCSLARALEVLGERWTLLIVRDAFYGLRRFGDFAEHLGIPRAVLTDRLHGLVDHGVLAKVAVPGSSYAEYELTPKGHQLWPVIYGLICWGDEHYTERGAPRIFVHAADAGRIGADSRCLHCGEHVDAAEIEALPGPGLDPAYAEDDLSVAMLRPRRLLEPLREERATRLTRGEPA